LHSTRTINHKPHHKHLSHFLSLLLKIKILTVFKNHQEHEEHYETLVFQNPKSVRIGAISSQFSEIRRWIFIIELRSLQFQHQFISRTNRCDHRDEEWEEEGSKVKDQAREEEKEESPIYFRFKPSPEESEAFLRIF
jgi:hypothetical protein